MTNYDRWLEKPYQDDCAREDEHNEVVEELLEGECNPQNPDAFMEAINEGACLSGKEFGESLKKILDKGHSYADLGELVWDAVSAYCNETAELRAESIIQLRNHAK